MRPVLGPHLKALVTDSELVDADFQELAARCPNLRKLQFVEPDAIVDDGIQDWHACLHALAAACPRLQLVRVLSCDELQHTIAVPFEVVYEG